MEPGKPIRVLVCGGRNYYNKARVAAVLAAVDAKYPIDAVIQGAATGADEPAAHWGWDNKRRVCSFAADWDDIERPGAVIRTRRDGKKYDVLAGHHRNTRMLEEGKPDCAIAFPGGSGTADMVKKIKAAGIPIWEIK